MTRRALLKGTLQASIAASVPSTFGLVGCGRKRRRRTGGPPSVILISLDTVRADHLGCYGYDRPTTPAVDEFAKRAVLFEDAMAPAPWTLTAHASLLTGLYPSRCGVQSRRDRLPDDVPTVAECLREHGYTTAGIVNSHWLAPSNGLHTGFAHFDYVKEELEQVGPSMVAEKALKWLSRNDEEPFFLFLHFYDAHSDYDALPKYQEMFVGPYSGPADGSTQQLLAHRFRQFSFTDADMAHVVDLYDANIRQLDDELGRIFDFLEDEEFLSNTLVLITSDHGEEFLDHGEVLHGRTFFDEIIHVPLIARGPGLPESLRISQTVSLLDVMPTIFGYLGISSTVASDGIDVRFLWEQSDAPQPHRFLFSEADWNNLIKGKTVDNFKKAVRHGQYKLHYNRYSKGYQLYDLAEDPSELHDVAADHSPLVELLLEQLDVFMQTDKAGQASAPLSQEEVERLQGLGYL